MFSEHRADREELCAAECEGGGAGETAGTGEGGQWEKEGGDIGHTEKRFRKTGGVHSPERTTGTSAQTGKRC